MDFGKPKILIGSFCKPSHSGSLSVGPDQTEHNELFGIVRLRQEVHRL